MILPILLAATMADATPQPSEVRPIQWKTFENGVPTDERAAVVRGILLNANKFTLSSWWKTKKFPDSVGEPLDFGGTEEPHIRPTASAAVALAISLNTGAYDPSVTGMPVEMAADRAIQMIGSLAGSHKASRGGGWGDRWQSAFWSALTGQAAWLMWGRLPPEDRKAVVAMVEHEANRFIDYKAPYYRSREGLIITRGDSKAEENSWNANNLQLAVAMMPEHPNRNRWESKCIELTISAFAMPRDLQDKTTLLHGRPVSTWLNGSNANDDGLLINHHLIHPDYICVAAFGPVGGMFSLLGGQPISEACRFGVARMYAALVDFNFKPGDIYPDTETSKPFKDPGGAIFRVDSADLYYPQGNDWGTNRRMHVALFDALADAFELDRLASRKGAYWEFLHAGEVAKMQARFSDGRTYGASQEDTYNGREEWVALHAGYAWLGKWLRHQGKISYSNHSLATQ